MIDIFVYCTMNHKLIKYYLRWFRFMVFLVQELGLIGDICLNVFTENYSRQGQFGVNGVFL